jgi:hypothetical protein
MSATAYLNVAIRIRRDEGPFPPVVCVAIHSSPPGGLTATSGELWANVLSVNGKTFGEAKDHILWLVESVDAFAWMRVWLREDYATHQERFELYEQRQRILDGQER